jgi:broad specificity phosphatase PhoE
MNVKTRRRKDATRLLHLCVAALTLVACSCAAPPAAPTTVLVVRHAEKASGGDNPPLTEAGASRAEALAGVAREAGVRAIYSSQFIRNVETVRPLSEAAGVPVTQMEVSLQEPGDYGKRLADEILAKHAGETVVVVSHLNTIPAIVEALSGRPIAPLNDVEYANLFVVVVPRDGEPRVVRAQYGQPDGL